MARVWMLIDANNLAHRMFHVLPAMPVDNRQTGAIFGFLKMLIRLRDETAATGLVFCFDKGPYLRSQVFPGYKVKPPGKPALPHKDKKFLDRQVYELRTEILPRIGFRNVWQIEGYEADDLIAGVIGARMVKRAVIVSSDKDLYQCLEDSPVQVSQYDLNKKREVTLASFREEYGIDPSEWPKVKALCGCDSDRVPGIKGIGEATALKSVKGTLNQQLTAARSIKLGKETVQRNLKLVRLPFDGLTLPQLKEDVDDYTSWRLVLEELKATRLLDRS